MGWGPRRLEPCQAPEVFVGRRWRYHHCDSYSIYLWGQRIRITVSSGKSGPSRAFAFSPTRGIFQSITVWSSDVSLSPPPWGDSADWPGGAQLPYAFQSVLFSDAFRKSESRWHSEGAWSGRATSGGGPGPPWQQGSLGCGRRQLAAVLVSAEERVWIIRASGTLPAVGAENTLLG